MTYSLKVQIGFPNQETAQMVCDVVGVDKEFKKHEIQRKLTVENNTLIIEYISNDMKLMRNGYNTLSEHMHLSLETIKQFSLPN